MIIKLRLKLGSSADKRCVWLCRCAATAIWKWGFWQFSGLWSQIREVKGVTGLWFLVQVGQTRAGGEQNRQTVAIVQEERQKQSCRCFRCQAMTCVPDTDTEHEEQQLLFLFSLSPKKYLRESFIHWCPFLWVVNGVDVWSFLSDLRLIFKTQPSLIDCCCSAYLLKVITDGYTVALWRLITARGASLVYSFDSWGAVMHPLYWPSLRW